MDPSVPDLSSRSNSAILSELLDPVPVVRLPFLGRNCMSVSALKRASKQFQKELARLIDD
jgi:hypothetical protein